MEGLTSNYTWIYDLKNRSFLDAKYELRDAAIVADSNGRMAVAGVNVKDSLAKLQVYTLPAEDREDDDVIKLYECQFERNRIPFSPVYAGDGYISYILAEGNARFLCKFSFEGKGLESKWIIAGSDSGPLRIQKLTWSPASALAPASASATAPVKAQPLYTFTFTRPELNSFTRTGFIYLTDSFEPESVKLTSADVSGGMNYAALSHQEETLLYSSKKFTRNQLASLPLSDLPLEEGSIQKTDIRNEVFYSNQFIPETALSDYNGTDVINQLRKGNRIIYMRGDGRYYHVWFIFRKYIDGHAWVVDGYIRSIMGWDVKYYLHCNWGWDGNKNGYFLRDIFDTEEGPAYYDDGTPTRSYSNYQYNLKTSVICK